VALVVTSCKKEEKANKTDPGFVPLHNKRHSSNNVNSTNGQNHNLFRENNGVTTTVLGGINPAHGQPNHRCDIAVGAPLNSVSNSASAKVKFSNTTSKYNC
jgi:hypothetical protein